MIRALVILAVAVIAAPALLWFVALIELATWCAQ